MTAQEIFKSKGYSTSDNRSIDWKNINKAMNFGILLTVVPLGKIRLYDNKPWNIALSFKKPNGKYVVRYFKSKNLSQYICEQWQSNSSDVVGSIIINYIIFFRQELIDLGLFNEAKKIAKEKCMEKCSKCKGKGIIPHFMYYCKGVCFDCLGLGYK